MVVWAVGWGGCALYYKLWFVRWIKRLVIVSAFRLVSLVRVLVSQQLSELGKRSELSRSQVSLTGVSTSLSTKGSRFVEQCWRLFVHED